jgi:hypothetical protein
MRRAAVIVLLAITMLASAPPTMAGRAQTTAAPASPLNDLAWLAGRWVGKTARGAYIEEHWMPAHDGLMLGSFRWDRGNHRWLFEFMSLEADPAVPATLVLRLKHFDRSFTGLEEKTASTTFRAIETSADRVLFELKEPTRVVRLTYARTGPDALTVTFEESEPGKPATRIEFPYARVT